MTASAIRAWFPIFFAVFAALLLFAAVPAWTQETSKPPQALGSPAPTPKGSEWLDLLDPDHLANWEVNLKAVQEPVFEMRQSELHIFGKHSGVYVGYLKERLHDFALHVEFRVAKGTNSGVLLRAEPESPALSGFEIQILDDFGRAPTQTSCGALFDVATPMFNMSMPTGQWNSYDVTLQGRNLVVVMNGWKILDVDMAKMTKPMGRFAVPYAEMALDGYIFLEDHGGEVWYRNILLKKL